MASKETTKKTKNDNNVTGFIGDLVDSTKEFVDDLVATASKVEDNARKHTTDARKRLTPSEKDLNKLRDQIDKLSDQVEKLAKFKKNDD